MAYQAIELSVADGLARLTLNQPAEGNPFNARFCRDVKDAACELSSRADVRAVLLRANGKFFSVGGDVRMFAQHLDELPRLIRDWTADLHVGLARLLRMNAPIVAAVHGTAAGGAVALIASCDLVYCARSAMLGAAYSQIGYSCDAGSSFALASRMGIARARRFLILGEMLTAEQAGQAGLVDHVVDDQAVVAEAEKAALRLSQGPTRAYGEIRRLLSRALGRELEAQLEEEAQASARVAGSHDAREGITAFVEKRRPKFRGE
jgi:2-(1,2-epoxy-1,2-dihydrophenyl)acetyl-CoA isomerase